MAAAVPRRRGNGGGSGEEEEEGRPNGWNASALAAPVRTCRQSAAMSAKLSRSTSDAWRADATPSPPPADRRPPNVPASSASASIPVETSAAVAPPSPSPPTSNGAARGVQKSFTFATLDAAAAPLRAIGSGFEFGARPDKSSAVRQPNCQMSVAHATSTDWSFAHIATCSGGTYLEDRESERAVQGKIEHVR